MTVGSLFQLSNEAQYVQTWGADKTVYVREWFLNLYTEQ